jgi:predicted dehydrogenase
LNDEIEDEFFDKAEMIKYLNNNGSGMIPAYSVEKGWAMAVENLAELIQNGQTQGDHATAEDGLKATQIAFAAVKSRDTGQVVDL